MVQCYMEEWAPPDKIQEPIPEIDKKIFFY
jgi:hypothetical protein